jgi:N-acetylglucosamine kinase-like BadF-type ATPase
MTLTIGVDVGGTKVAAGVVDVSGQVLAQTRRDTAARDADATLDAIVDAVKELAGHASRRGRRSGRRRVRRREPGDHACSRRTCRRGAANRCATS